MLCCTYGVCRAKTYFEESRVKNVSEIVKHFSEKQTLFQFERYVCVSEMC